MDTGTPDMRIDSAAAKGKWKCRIIGAVVGAVAIVGALIVFAHCNGVTLGELAELGADAVATRASRHTSKSRAVAILAKKPNLKEVAKSAGGKLRIFVFKNERMVELHASGWKEPRKYPMTAFSGTLGPKLRKGRKPELEKSSLAWYPELCKEISAALSPATPSTSYLGD